MPTKRDLSFLLTKVSPTRGATPGSRAIFKVLVVLMVIVSLGIVEIDAQTRRKRRTRRTTKPRVQRPVITNPTIAPPTATADQSANDVKIISTADQTTDEQNPVDESETKKTKKPGSSQEPDDMQQTIMSLTNQVNRLNDRLTAMQEDDRYLLDMERLTRAEQRAEQLRSQLIDAQTKIADLESRLDQVEFMLKPENIDKATQGYGSVRPEEARETRRRQLENEKNRLKAQLSILETSKVRLEQAIATADNEVDLIRARLNQQRLDDAMRTTPAKPTTKRPE